MRHTQRRSKYLAAEGSSQGRRACPAAQRERTRAPALARRDTMSTRDAARGNEVCLSNLNLDKSPILWTWCHSRHERRVHTVNAFLSGDHRICTVNAKKRAMNAPSHNSCKNAFKLRSRLLEPSHRRPATPRTPRSSPRMPRRPAPWSRPLVNVCHYGHRRRSPPFRVAFSRRAGRSERERERERQTGVRVCACYVAS